MLQASHLESILPQASRERLRAFAPFLDAAMRKFGIDRNLRRAAAFIAQLAHESGQFRFMQELWGPTDAQRRYEPPGSLANRLGNTEPGDGYRFRGRGAIQLTGRANYAKYGQALGLDLVASPDLAAGPDAGFLVAGLFWQRNGLNALADAGDFVGVTKRINGGTNGLAERRALYEAALKVLAPVFPATSSATDQGSAKRAAPAPAFDRGAEAIRELALPKPRAAKKTPAKTAPAQAPRRKFDARPDTLDFRDVMYVPSLVEVPTHIPLEDYLDIGVPILDQGSEGACTGYGLATVCHYLLLRRKVLPDAQQVSPRMLYHLARRYDEWPGEKYDGSSARGAMKGWHKHGVCPEDLYPSKGKDKGLQLTEERTSAARRRPLGAYYRVNHKDIVAMHSAIAEVGVLYATCVVHKGWDRVGSDGAIPFTNEDEGGHAFAIVAYDDQGFWLQNSWGPDWGHRGFARISYDDWLRNGTDVWVARLGAPVTLRTAESTATAHSAAARESAAYSYADLRPHIVAVGNDGRLRPGGDYGTSPAGLAHIFEEDIPRVTQGWGARPRILLYAHGGLVGETSAVQRLADYRPQLLEKKVYPLAFVWKTDYWTTITNVLRDAVRRRRPEGALDAAKDFMLDRFDDALEPLARMLTGKAAWDEIKENATLASAPGGAGALVVQNLVRLQQAIGPVEVHLVAHSAGSILMAPLLTLLNASGIEAATCTLWAPACTMDVFDRHYRPAMQSGGIGRMALYVLSDKAEQDDHCARIYNKSLLYLVSNAFESVPRIPVFRDGVPLLGMDKFLDAVRPLFAGKHELVIAPDGVDRSQAREHGAFDDDRATVASTFARIVGEIEPPAVSPVKKVRVRKAGPAGAGDAAQLLKFRRSASSLSDRRQAIDVKTR
jgi:predicted chitinase